ncbi:MAG: hypothetical protein WDW36_006439 [Sanguina aurantia]
MNWGPMDEWTVSAELPAGSETEFKFVIRNQQGQISEWQGGPNCSVTPPIDASEVHVTESWTATASPTLTVLASRPAPEATHAAQLESPVVVAAAAAAAPEEEQLQDAVREAQEDAAPVQVSREQSLQAFVQAREQQASERTPMQASLQAEEQAEQPLAPHEAEQLPPVAEQQEGVPASVPAPVQAQQPEETKPNREADAIWFTAATLRSVSSMDEYDGSFLQRKSTGADPLGHADSWAMQGAAAAAVSSSAPAAGSGGVSSQAGFAWEKAKKIRKKAPPKKSAAAAKAGIAAEPWGGDAPGSSESSPPATQNLQDITVSEMKAQLKRRGLSSLGDRREIIQRLKEAGSE